MDTLQARTEEVGASGVECRCEPAFEADGLVVDATDCPGGGRLAVAPSCRATVVEALTDGDVETVETGVAGVEAGATAGTDGDGWTGRTYGGWAVALLVAAGRFVEAARRHDERLADRALADPLGAAREACGRTGPVARLAAETGLAELAHRADGYAVLRPSVERVAGRSRADGPPTGPAPGPAAALARTVDSVASSPHEAVARHPLAADRISLGSRRVAVRTDGGTAGATLDAGGVVPAFDHDALAAVLSGRPPGEVFADESAFAAALADAQTRNAWRPAPERVLVRRVTWAAVEATLVGGGWTGRDSTPECDPALDGE